MTVGVLIDRLAKFRGNLEVVVRCNLDGAEPRGWVFQPRVLVQETEPDTAEDFVAIECDQDED